MDPKLAEIYGTNQTTEADIEKLAAAELATQLAGDDEINTEAMTEEDLEAIAQQVLAPAEEEQQGEDGQEKTSAEEEAQEKVAEADYLGRVMAHSYVQELNEIEKTAGAKEVAGKVLGAVKKYHAGAAEDVKGAVKGVKSITGKSGGVRDFDLGAKGRVISGAKGAAKFLPHAAAATAAGVGAKKAFGGKKGKEKKSAAEGEQELSAVDTLVLARANEILQASGIDPESLKPVEQEQEKVSADETVDPREVLANEVEQRAWNLLGQYGVTPAEQEPEQQKE
jgi:hypothetical protein